MDLENEVAFDDDQEMCLKIGLDRRDLLDWVSSIDILSPHTADLEIYFDLLAMHLDISGNDKLDIMAMLRRLVTVTPSQERYPQALPLPVRQLLLRDILYNILQPELSIRQIAGNCAVAALEYVIAKSHPERYTWAVCQMALTGTYNMVFGPNRHRPLIFEPDNLLPSEDDYPSNHASRLMQLLIANLHWQEEQTAEFFQGYCDLFFNEARYLMPPLADDHALMRYTFDKTEHLKNYRGEPIRHPHTNCIKLHDAYVELTGDRMSTVFLEADWGSHFDPPYIARFDPADNLQRPQKLHELLADLTQRSPNGNLLLLTAVDGNKRPFSDGTKPGREWHRVTITRYDPDKRIIYVNDPTGITNHRGHLRMSLRRFFEVASKPDDVEEAQAS